MSIFQCSTSLLSRLSSMLSRLSSNSEKPQVSYEPCATGIQNVFGGNQSPYGRIWVRRVWRTRVHNMWCRQRSSLSVLIVVRSDWKGISSTDENNMAEFSFLT